MDRAAHLRALLTAHPVADAEESTHRARMLALLAAGDDPFRRDHFSPGHFTASAFVISHDDARLLLILHAKLGRWLQPGGHIDLDDADVIAAARREVAEETGLSGLTLVDEAGPLLDLDIHVIPPNPRKGEPAHEHLDVRVLLRAGPDAAARAGSDARDLRWVPLAEVNAVESDASVMRAVAKLIARRGR